MFRLSDSTRRKITLGLFFAFCVVPTAIVLTLVAWQNRPGHVQAEADRLGRLLGRKVTLAGVQHPRPNETVYHQLTVSDPESGKPLFHCGRLQAAFRHVEDQRGQGKPCLMLIASRARADADELDQFRRLVDRLLSGGTAWSGIDLRIAVSGELELLTGTNLATRGSPLTLTDVGGHIVTNAEGALAEVWFRQADLQMPDPIRISVQRHRQTDPPETHLRINTGRSSLPTPVLALGLKQFDHLGPTCRFRGVLDSHQTVDGSSGNLTGHFQDVDLDSVVSDRFAHRLGGMAQLGIEKARFSHGRLVDASGWLQSGPGLVSQSLLDAAHQSLGLPRGRPADPRVDQIPYDRLAVSFAVDSTALKLRGQCPTDSGEAIMTDSNGPLLGPSPISTISTHPVASLIEALLPNEPAQVSATRQAARLMSRLPLPEARQPVKR
jgi:hypothetical protein